MCSQVLTGPAGIGGIWRVTQVHHTEKRSKTSQQESRSAHKEHDAVASLSSDRRKWATLAVSRELL